jgi:hypothetical protein
MKQSYSWVDEPDGALSGVQTGIINHSEDGADDGGSRGCAVNEEEATINLDTETKF